MTQLLANPVRWSDIRRDMTPAERFFACCLSHGLPCKLGNAVPQAPTPRNTVRPEVIRFFAYGGDSDKRLVRGSAIRLQGAWVCGKEHLNLAHADIPYALAFRNCHFAVDVKMQHAKCAEIHMGGSRLAKELKADGLTTKGGVFLANGFSAEGKVRLMSANIGGNLSCTGGIFNNRDGSALDAAGVTTKGSVYLNKGFCALGEVRLLGASIGGKLDCAGGRFENPDNNGKKYALNAEQVSTGGHVYLNKDKEHGGDKPFVARGRVRFANADISGNFNCKGGQFLHSGEHSTIAAGGLRSRGAVFLSEGFFAKGEVALHVSRIGNFVCKECNPTSKGVINLASTKAVAVDDDKKSWELFEFVLDDFTYDAFFGANTPKDGSRCDWLAKRPKEMPSKDGEPVKVLFSSLPYEQAAKVLFGMGHARDAREVLLEKERLQTKDSRTPWHHKIGRRLWDEFAGYGYRLRRTVGWSLAAVVVGWGVFSHASDMGDIVPHQPAILASDEYQQARQGGFAEMESVREKFSEYPEFNPLVFSADVFIPLFALHQEPFWYPVAGSENILALLAASQHGLALAVGGALLALWLFTALEEELRSRPRLAKRWKRLPRQVCSLVLRAVVVLSFYALGLESPRHWYWLEIGFGWILTSLFLLSVTGVLRPRQSSGEKG